MPVTRIPPPSNTPLRFWKRRSLHELTPEECEALIEAQVRATRPIVSAVIGSAAFIVGLIGGFEAVGIVPGIGYPWWVVELAALAIAGCALATWHIADWRVRLLLTLLATVLTGTFLTMPVPGHVVQLAVRVGLFQLMPIALLALLARRTSIWTLAFTMFALAALRAGLYGMPASGAALYWLYTFTAIGFGLLLGGYRLDFAVSNFRMRQRLHQQASTDALTGLANRAGWERIASELYEDAVRRGVPVSVAFFDVDHFKAINDTHGHAAGDTVLQTLAAVLRERLPSRGLAARQGGEEFVALLIDQPPEATEGYVQRVRSEFAQATGAFAATVSAGIAHRQTGESMPQQLRRADVALYEAKAAGRDRLVVSRAEAAF
jgi:diguanylate cyclase (GGDEF)-like protein